MESPCGAGLRTVLRRAYRCLVDWLNAVDQSCRQEFRDLFEANFARLEARLAQQSAELRAEFTQQIAALEVKLVRWMFAFWIGSWATILATVIALRQIGWLGAP